MKRGTLRAIFIATIALTAVSAIGLWAWNKLAGPFDMPEVQHLHALAALTLLGIVRLGLGGRRKQAGHGCAFRRAAAGAES